MGSHVSFEAAPRSGFQIPLSAAGGAETRKKQLRRTFPESWCFESGAKKKRTFHDCDLHKTRGSPQDGAAPQDIHCHGKPASRKAAERAARLWLSLEPSGDIKVEG